MLHVDIQDDSDLLPLVSVLVVSSDHEQGAWIAESLYSVNPEGSLTVVKASVPNDRFWRACDSFLQEAQESNSLVMTIIHGRELTLNFLKLEIQRLVPLNPVIVIDQHISRELALMYLSHGAVHVLSSSQCSQSWLKGKRACDKLSRWGALTRLIEKRSSDVSIICQKDDVCVSQAARIERIWKSLKSRSVKIVDSLENLQRTDIVVVVGNSVFVNEVCSSNRFVFYLVVCVCQSFAALNLPCVSNAVKVDILDDSEVFRFCQYWEKECRVMSSLALSFELGIPSIDIHEQKSIRSLTINDFEILQVSEMTPEGSTMTVMLRSNRKIYKAKTYSKVVLTGADASSHMISLRSNVMELGSCPFVSKLWFAFQDSSNIYMVSDLPRGGTLFDLLQRVGRLSEDSTRFYSAEILAALEHCHLHAIALRNLSSRTIQFGMDGWLIHFFKLMRLGHLLLDDLCWSKRLLEADKYRSYSFCGEEGYQAPEVLEGDGHSFSVDFWALGVLIYEMLIGKNPFENQSREDYKSDWALHFPEYVSKKARDLISRLLCRDPACRLGSIEREDSYVCNADLIKSHDFFSSVDWDTVSVKKLTPPYRPLSSLIGSDSSSRSSTAFSGFSDYISKDFDSIPLIAVTPKVYQRFASSVSSSRSTALGSSPQAVPRKSQDLLLKMSDFMDFKEKQSI